MIQTVEAVIDEDGAVRLLQPVEITGRHRVLVTILDEKLVPNASGKDASDDKAADSLDDQELTRWHEASAGAQAYRERMAEKHGLQPDTTKIIREARDNPRA